MILITVNRLPATKYFVILQTFKKDTMETDKSIKLFDFLGILALKKKHLFLFQMDAYGDFFLFIPSQVEV